PEKESTFSRSSLKELHQQLEKAVDNENYELAAKIRDEISKR
ncbi:UvrB/UvrC motif-containing protein, partial [Polaribacter sp.]|nr:UvrB/UvrC motif-containing protein [Polaribacter sp.]